jgi:molybdopterin-guanine dinucleotide biosynthesis protein A
VYNGNPQPLPGIYSRAVKDVIEDRIISKSRAMRDLLKDIDVYYVREQEVLKVDPEGKSFTNINTREDLKQITGG